jgi:hypothetical protein
MAPGDAYFTPSTGKLKLKGVQGAKIEKKKKKAKNVKKDGEDGAVVSGASEAREEGSGGGNLDDGGGEESEFKDRSVVLKRLAETDEEFAREGRAEVMRTRRRDGGDGGGDDDEGGHEGREIVKTEAEK